MIDMWMNKKSTFPAICNKNYTWSMLYTRNIPNKLVNIPY
jgi:hypothetical protein